MIITKLKQVEEIAKQFLQIPLVVMPLKDISAVGKKGIKMIVGQKENPAYDAKLAETPFNSPNLPIEYKENKNLYDNKTNPKTADVRILWLAPGTTDKELINNFLVGIKKSLETKKPDIVVDDTITKIDSQESDADIAAKLAKGEDITPGYEEWDDGYEAEEVGSEEEISEDMAVLDETDNLEEEENSDTNAILEAINQVNDNVKVVSSDLGKAIKRIQTLEKGVKTVKKQVKSNKDNK